MRNPFWARGALEMMGFFSSKRPAADRILDGARGGSPPDDRVAAVVRAIPGTFAARPDEATEARHIALVVEAAARTASAPESGRASRAQRGAARRRSALLVGKLAAAVVAGSALMASLAVAGVTLPGPARGIADAVGLPHQAPAEEVRDLIDSTPPSERGCEFGRRVAAAASKNSRGRSARSPRPCEDRTEARPSRHGRDSRRDRGAAGDLRGETLPPAARRRGPTHPQSGTAPRRDVPGPASRTPRPPTPAAAPQPGTTPAPAPAPVVPRSTPVPPEIEAPATGGRSIGGPERARP